MKPPSSDAEALRRQQTAQVRAADRLLVAPDELRDVKRGHQAIRQLAVRGRRVAGELRVGGSIHRFPVLVLSHTSSSAKRCGVDHALDAMFAVATRADKCRQVQDRLEPICKPGELGGWSIEMGDYPGPDWAPSRRGLDARR
jgi:hypothetical protein